MKIKTKKLTCLLLIVSGLSWGAFGGAQAANTQAANTQATNTQTSDMQEPELQLVQQENNEQGLQSFQLESCHVPQVSEQVECGYYSVPVHYEHQEGEQIALHVVRLPAIQSGLNHAPMFLLAGGPGQAATEVIPIAMQMLKDVRATRDLVFIDQRGTGKSHPIQCELDEITRVESLLMTDDEFDVQVWIEQCLAQHADVDLQQYNTLNAVRDFDRVRQALGYEQIVLYGASYGTRSGLAFMREFPASIEAAVLDSVAPPQVPLGDFAPSANTVLDAVFHQCEAEEKCQQAFPNLKQSYQALMQYLEPGQQIQVRDARSHEKTELLLTSSKFNQVLFASLYSPMAQRLLPLVITEAADDNYLPFIGLNGPFDADAFLYMGMSLSVLCQEDIHRLSAVQEDTQDVLGLHRQSKRYQEMCAHWPVKPETDASLFAAVVSDIPTLLLSGELDPVTPPAWADLANETLSAGRHIQVPNAAHSVAGHTCASKVIAHFFDNPSADDEELELACLLEHKASPFILNVNGQGM